MSFMWLSRVAGRAMCRSVVRLWENCSLEGSALSERTTGNVSSM